MPSLQMTTDYEYRTELSEAMQQTACCQILISEFIYRKNKNIQAVRIPDRLNILKHYRIIV